MYSNSTCSLTECSRPSYCRGWCALHYSRWRANGDPRIIRTLEHLPLIERFAHYVSFGEGCWEWRGARDKDGYGVFSIGRRTVRPHRFFFEVVYGPIASSMQLDHARCANPPCVRPDHLEVVTLREQINWFEKLPLFGTPPGVGNNGNSSYSNSVFFCSSKAPLLGLRYEIISRIGR